MGKRIAKVKQAEGRIVIRIVDTESWAKETETVFKCAEQPHPEFLQAFAAIEPHARDVLGWPPEYAKGRIRITGVSFSYSENTEVEGSVITGLVELDTSDAPFSFNTPHLPWDQYSEGGHAKLMPDEAIEALQELREEAAAFLGGKRAPKADTGQSDLFASNDDGKQRPPGGKDAAAEQGSAL